MFKSCSVSAASSVSTSVGEEFEISYRFSTYSIVSGSVAIQYDPELFAVVSATPGGFLADKIADVNTQMNGAVYISFVGTKQQYKYDLITVRLEKDSMLGAGDFVLRFDAGMLTYVSAQKEFRPNFFLMNEASVSNGVLKFYLLSTENLVEEQTVLTVTFDVKSACVDQITDFIIEGSICRPCL